MRSLARLREDGRGERVRSSIRANQRAYGFCGVSTSGGFGLGLAIGSYGLAGLISLGTGYYMLFVIAQGILVVALLLSIWLLFRPPDATARAD